ncbi:MAG: hypothetical protein COT81_05775 [Candidatus Buchananbacteria bacterium CG10_big_fil_rev_8_21_14_0_10_42_9]|uniref:Uncharacterized protein n=1 Tax=Candidatus Buchananbacteria bacterium CG10_big_fil_rev_8_21_14_0_10_42_9 TaxID=1974526 RepID=A0A2H0VZR8_9BACT|nr:MAG: hypothetical protein COT81_05775 [Candidatus Buchananbacteria bacterium CG10_big_fil_rev_8_21_14_0_10_42_9]
MPEAASNPDIASKEEEQQFLIAALRQRTEEGLKDLLDSLKQEHAEVPPAFDTVDDYIKVVQDVLAEKKQG